MTSRLEEMNQMERAARDRWLYGSVEERIQPATHVHFGLCDGCGRIEDDQGRMLLVARRPGKRGFFCLPCFDLEEPR